MRFLTFLYILVCLYQWCTIKNRRIRVRNSFLCPEKLPPGASMRNPGKLRLGSRGTSTCLEMHVGGRVRSVLWLNAFKMSKEQEEYPFEALEPIPFSHGCTGLLLTVVFFAIINKIVTTIGPPESVDTDAWRWNNLFISWIHAFITGSWDLLWLVLIRIDGNVYMVMSVNVYYDGVVSRRNSLDLPPIPFLLVVTGKWSKRVSTLMYLCLESD